MNESCMQCRMPLEKNADGTWERHRGNESCIMALGAMVEKLSTRVQELERVQGSGSPPGRQA